MSKTKKIIIGLLVVVASVFVVFNVVQVFDVFSLFIEQKSPQITEGEFPFFVEYEINGERYIIEDTVICSFRGYDNSAWFTKRRTWNSKLKSGNEEKCVLINEENTQSVLSPERINIRSRLVLDYGSPEYYMDDPNAKSLIDKEAAFEYRENWKASEKVIDVEHTKLNEKELEKYFGIKIIRFEFSEPIKNTFK